MLGVTATRLCLCQKLTCRLSGKKFNYFLRPVLIILTFFVVFLYGLRLKIAMGDTFDSFSNIKTE